MQIHRYLPQDWRAVAREPRSLHPFDQGIARRNDSGFDATSTTVDLTLDVDGISITRS